MSYAQLPCSELSFQQRVNRVVDAGVITAGSTYRKTERPEKIEAGVCQLCGRALPVAYRAVRYRGDGNVDLREAAPNTAEAEKLRERFEKDGLANLGADGWIVLRVSACECLNEDVFRAADREIERRRREEFGRGKLRAPITSKPPRLRDPVPVAAALE